MTSTQQLWNFYKKGKELDEAFQLLKKETSLDFNEIQNHRSILHYACNFGHLESKTNSLQLF
jgi:hypothetical protein